MLYHMVLVMKNKFICCLLLVTFSASVGFGQGTFNAIASGSWNTPANWSLTGGADADNIPDADDAATIPSGIRISMTGGTSFQIASLNILDGGTLEMDNANAVLDIVPDDGLLQVDFGAEISNPTINDGNQINFLATSTFVNNGIVQTDLLEFEGLNQRVLIMGSGNLLVVGFGVNNSGITIELNTTGSFASNLIDFEVDQPNLTISGTGTIEIGGDQDVRLSSTGLIIGCHMNINVDGADANTTADGDFEMTGIGSTLTIANGGAVVTGDDLRVGPDNLDASNSNITVDNGGVLDIGDDINFHNSGTLGHADGFVLTNNGTISVAELLEFNSETSITITNNNLFTVTGSIISVAAASSVTFTNAANATFNIGGSIDIDMVLDFTATGNTVNYFGGTLGVNQTIRTSTIYYHLTLSGSGARSLGGDITLRGNWTRSDAATFTPGTNTVTFAALAGTAGQTISAVGGETFYRLTINSAFETSPQIILNNPVTVSNQLTMTAGNINLNNNSFALISTSSTALVHTLASASGWMYGGSMTRTRPGSTSFAVSTARAMFPLGSATDWRPFMVGQASDAGTAGTITVLHDASTTTTSTVSFPEGITRRHNNFWTLSTTATGGTYSLSAGGTTWGTIEAGAAGLLDLRMSTSTGVVGTHAASTGGPDYRVNRTAVAFADLANNYHVASTDATNTPLPIELTSFAGRVVENNVRLSWETASERNNDFFTVERSSNGEVFSSIGQVKGTGTTNQSHSYALVDYAPIHGNAYYRLKQTNFDGTFTYSKIIDVKYEGLNIPVIEVFPNPSTGHELNIKITGLKNIEFVPVVMYDQFGRECMKLWMEVDQHSGTASKTFTPENAIPQGIYVLKAGTTAQLTKRVVVNSK
jgi:hypothetical protein